MALVLLQPLKSGGRATQRRNKELPELCGRELPGPVREVRLEREGGAEQGQGAEEERWEGREGWGG